MLLCPARRLTAGFWLACAWIQPVALPAAEPLPGHSVHGEAFNEGPRQEAHLMEGVGEVSFPVTTSKPLAQRFFNQGIAQLHGFWYFEAERSFRQVAKLDPDCAMAYWGMALANVNNEKRARGLLVKASDRKSKASAREQLWITFLENYLKDDKRDDKQKELDAIRDLEAIVHAHPKDIEAKAFLAWKIWQGKSEVPIASPITVQALLDQIFAADSDHPAHHYSIHLWDGFKPEPGLVSAAAGGPAAPGIAHMWHMPGHIYSKLRRFDDAAWQQEASTRVDHAYMMANCVQPDQIHNYAHNEEWLIRTYNELGQAGKARALAQRLITHPQHPANNTLDRGGCSASYGRTRLIETLIKWELWPELLAVCADDSRLIPTVPQLSHEVTRLRALGLAHFAQESPAELTRVIDRLAKLDADEAAKAKPKEAPPKPQPEAASKPAAVTKEAPAKETSPKASTPAKPACKPAAQPAAPAKAAPASKPARTASRKTRPTEKPLAELRTLLAVLKHEPDAAKKLEAAKDLDKLLAAQAWLHLNQPEKAATAAQGLAQDLAGHIAKAALLDRCGKTDDARKAFEAARQAAYGIDEDLPATRKLQALAKRFPSQTWRDPAPTRTDLGARPPLDTLGPFLWSPPAAPEWSALDAQNQPTAGRLKPGTPRLLVFYLGSECSHCVDQLNTLSKHLGEFTAQGIEVLAISPQLPADAPKVLPKLTHLKDPAKLHLLSDPHFIAFRAFRAYDDFENDALHATVLLDASNRVRWIDISYQPFMDIPFLVKESRRLLNLPEVP